MKACSDVKTLFSKVVLLSIVVFTAFTGAAYAKSVSEDIASKIINGFGKLQQQQQQQHGTLDQMKDVVAHKPLALLAYSEVNAVSCSSIKFISQCIVLARTAVVVFNE